jgi:hypothetical protein
MITRYNEVLSDLRHYLRHDRGPLCLRLLDVLQRPPLSC